MKNFLKRVNNRFWNLIGICVSEKCFKKAEYDVYIPCLDKKFCLCEKHTDKLISFGMDKNSEIKKK